MCENMGISISVYKRKEIKIYKIMNLNYVTNF